MQAAVERKFTIIGEALVQLSKVDRLAASSVPDCRQIIGFRNLLVHGYSIIDPRVVWKVVTEDLQKFVAEVEKMLA